MYLPPSSAKLLFGVLIIDEASRLPDLSLFGPPEQILDSDCLALILNKLAATSEMVTLHNPTRQLLYHGRPIYRLMLCTQKWYTAGLCYVFYLNTTTRHISPLLREAITFKNLLKLELVVPESRPSEKVVAALLSRAPRLATLKLTFIPGANQLNIDQHVAKCTTLKKLHLQYASGSHSADTARFLQPNLEYLVLDCINYHYSPSEFFSIAQVTPNIKRIKAIGLCACVFAIASTSVLTLDDPPVMPPERFADIALLKNLQRLDLTELPATLKDPAAFTPESVGNLLPPGFDWRNFQIGPHTSNSFFIPVHFHLGDIDSLRDLLERDIRPRDSCLVQLLDARQGQLSLWMNRELFVPLLRFLIEECRLDPLAPVKPVTAMETNPRHNLFSKVAASPHLDTAVVQYIFEEVFLPLLDKHQAQQSTTRPKTPGQLAAEWLTPPRDIGFHYPMLSGFYLTASPPGTAPEGKYPFDPMARVDGVPALFRVPVWEHFEPIYKRYGGDLTQLDDFGRNVIEYRLGQEQKSAMPLRLAILAPSLLLSHYDAIVANLPTTFNQPLGQFVDIACQLAPERNGEFRRKAALAVVEFGFPELIASLHLDGQDPPITDAAFLNQMLFKAIKAPRKAMLAFLASLGADPTTAVDSLGNNILHYSGQQYGEIPATILQAMAPVLWKKNSAGDAAPHLWAQELGPDPLLTWILQYSFTRQDLLENKSTRGNSFVQTAGHWKMTRLTRTLEDLCRRQRLNNHGPLLELIKAAMEEVWSIK